VRNVEGNLLLIDWKSINQYAKGQNGNLELRKIILDQKINQLKDLKQKMQLMRKLAQWDTLRC